MADSLRAQLKKKIDGIEAKAAVNAKVVELAIAGVEWATKLAYDRIDGAVPRAVELTGAEGGPIEVSDVSGSRDKLATRLAALTLGRGAPEGNSEPE